MNLVIKSTSVKKIQETLEKGHLSFFSHQTFFGQQDFHFSVLLGLLKVPEQLAEIGLLVK